jgi:hypothetical protein
MESAPICRICEKLWFLLSQLLLATIYEQIPDVGTLLLLGETPFFAA